MRIEIRDLSENDLEDAARLLAARHRADRTRLPVLLARYEDPDACRPLLARAHGRPLSWGVLALQDGESAGFMIGSVAFVPPTSWFAPFIPARSGQVAYHLHAAVGPDAAEVYRHLYAAIAPHWLANGCFTHFVELSAADEVALDAWFSLGFGRAITLAVRDTTPVAAEPALAQPTVEIHQAGTEDIDVILELNDDLARHHNASPIFLPYLPETEPDQRGHQLELLEDPANAHFFAYRDGQPVGMQTFHGLDAQDLSQPDRCIYLYQGITIAGGRGAGVGSALLRHSMDWARAQGYAQCALHFMTANIEGARFWTRSGFVPLTERLVRRVDERIAWARGEE